MITCSAHGRLCHADVALPDYLDFIIPCIRSDLTGERRSRGPKQITGSRPQPRLEELVRPSISFWVLEMMEECAVAAAMKPPSPTFKERFP